MNNNKILAFILIISMFNSVFAFKDVYNATREAQIDEIYGQVAENNFGITEYLNITAPRFNNNTQHCYALMDLFNHFRENDNKIKVAAIFNVSSFSEQIEYFITFNTVRDEIINELLEDEY
jgi:hypothetical protein